MALAIPEVDSRLKKTNGEFFATGAWAQPKGVSTHLLACCLRASRRPPSPHTPRPCTRAGVVLTASIFSRAVLRDDEPPVRVVRLPRRQHVLRPHAVVRLRGVHRLAVLADSGSGMPIGWAGVKAEAGRLVACSPGARGVLQLPGDQLRATKYLKAASTNPSGMRKVPPHPTHPPQPAATMAAVRPCHHNRSNCRLPLTVSRPVKGGL